MKRTMLALAALLVAGSALAADKSYQVTGPVTALTDTSITVQKGNDPWTLARGKGTKVTGDLKVGAKVTVYYTMTAVEIEAKADAKAAKAAKADASPTSPAKPAKK